MQHVNSGSSSAGFRWRYTTPAILLHWSMAILIAGMLALGWYMMSIEDTPGSGWYFDLHKSFGTILLALITLRLAWRASHPPHGLPSQVPLWQSRLARILHRLLYVLMVAVPSAGFLGALFSKDGLSFFGLTVPRWAAPNHDLSEAFFSLHGWLIWVLVGSITLHMLAGFKHWLIDKDGVFQRMWP